MKKNKYCAVTGLMSAAMFFCALNTNVYAAERINQLDIPSKIEVESEKKEFSMNITVDPEEAFAGLEFGINASDGCKITGVSYDRKVTNEIKPKDVSGTTWFSFFDSKNSYEGKMVVTVKGTCTKDATLTVQEAEMVTANGAKVEGEILCQNKAIELAYTEKNQSGGTSTEGSTSGSDNQNVAGGSTSSTGSSNSTGGSTSSSNNQNAAGGSSSSSNNQNAAGGSASGSDSKKSETSKKLTSKKSETSKKTTIKKDKTSDKSSSAEKDSESEVKEETSDVEEKEETNKKKSTSAENKSEDGKSTEAEAEADSESGISTPVSIFAVVLLAVAGVLAGVFVYKKRGKTKSE